PLAPSQIQTGSQVVEHDHAVAEQAPSLFGMRSHGAGGVTVRAVSRRAWGLDGNTCACLRSGAYAPHLNGHVEVPCGHSAVCRHAELVPVNARARAGIE